MGIRSSPLGIMLVLAFSITTMHYLPYMILKLKRVHIVKHEKHPEINLLHTSLNASWHMQVITFPAYQLDIEQLLK